MHMYKLIIDLLNNFLNYIHIPDTPLNPDVFQGVFVKKLSNQNIIKEKRRISANNTILKVNQTHIDVTGEQAKLFFFEGLSNTTTPPQSIDIDLYDNNLSYLCAINNPLSRLSSDGNTYFFRHSIDVPPYLSNWDLTLHSSAYKKYGHKGTQVQINIPDSNPLLYSKDMPSRTMLLSC